jgi:hypothetical protein
MLALMIMATRSKTGKCFEEGNYGQLLCGRSRVHLIRDTMDPSCIITSDDTNHGSYLTENLNSKCLTDTHWHKSVILRSAMMVCFNPDGIGIPLLHITNKTLMLVSYCNLFDLKQVNYGPCKRVRSYILWQQN